jgi:peptidoglycan hydrolase CwlO-like protein
MKFNTKTVSRLLLLGMVTISLTTVGCGRTPTPEEMDALNRQIRAADAAEAKVSDLEREKARLQRELVNEQQKLEALKAEFEEVKQRVAQKEAELNQRPRR